MLRISLVPCPLLKQSLGSWGMSWFIRPDLHTCCGTGMWGPVLLDGVSGTDREEGSRKREGNTYCTGKVGPMLGREKQWHPCIFLEPPIWWILNRCLWEKLGMLWKILYQVMKCQPPSLPGIHSVITRGCEGPTMWNALCWLFDIVAVRIVPYWVLVWHSSKVTERP